MNRRIAALLAIVSMLVVSLVAYVADADPIQVWNGDLDGSTNATKIVTGAKGQPLPTSGSGTLTWDGGSWFFGPSISPALAGQALFTNDAGTSTTWAYPHGDVDASATDPGALTVNAIQGFGVSTSVPSSGNALVYSSGLWRPSPINLAGGSASVTGTLPSANQAAQTMTGDVTGTTAANVVSTLTGSGGIVSAPTSAIAFGTNAATVGEVRAPNNTTIIAARNAANSADISVISTTSADQIVIGDVNVSVTFAARGGWGVTYSSGGTFYSSVGNLHLGTSAGAGFHTFLSAGAGTDVVDVTVPSVGSENTAFTGSIDLKPTSAPSSPASNTIREYVDTADGKLKAKDSAGNIFVLAP